MKNRVFNTPFELSLRTLIILAADKHKALSVDMITAIDFICIYGSTFEIAQENLHGNNAFNFSEFTTRREIVGKSLKALVLRNLICVVKQENGFCYRISDNGLLLSQDLVSDYATEYRTLVSLANELVEKKTEREIFGMINQHATLAFGMGGYHG